MSIPINNKQQWRFLYHDPIDPAGVPLDIKVEHGKTVLTAWEIQIELIKYDKDTGEITGTYQMSHRDPPLSGEIVFKVASQDEKKWVGRPTKFNGICIWTIWSVSPQSEDASLKSRIKNRFF